MTVSIEQSRRAAKALRSQIMRASERNQKSFTFPDLDAETVQELRKGGLKVEWNRAKSCYLISWD